MNTSYLYHSPKGGARRGLSLLLVLALSIAVQAQNTYMNERLTNNSSDVIGTARYVGMGGALGALGADMSVISWNPAGIGLYRKNDVALTMGGIWGKSSISEENRGKFTFDQAGFVFNMKTGGETCPYINFAVNYQKKINFNHNFYADNANLGGLSQMDQVAELARFYEDGGDNLARLALDNGYFNPVIDADRNQVKDEKGRGYYYNEVGASSNIYTHHSEGALHSFDFNLSTNIKDRAFLGMTIGVDAMRYRGWNLYGENQMDGSESYDLENYDIDIYGKGVNFKLGAIVRPVESSPFRIGFAVETPTWYWLKNNNHFLLRDYILGGEAELQNRLPFNLRTPWKVRTSIGSTVGSSFAWDVDYEYAAFAGSSMGYPEYEYADGNTSGNIKDVAMNQLTSDNLRGTHTLRVGLEANATKNLALRLGYNLSTSAYEKNIGFDQYSLNSAAMDYATSTSYMRLGNTNILTLGAGYRTKHFYVDLAYKVRNQHADFYAFDTSFANGDTQFVLDHQDMKGMTIDPVDVNLTRHAITCTLGVKF